MTFTHQLKSVCFIITTLATLIFLLLWNREQKVELKKRIKWPNEISFRKSLYTTHSAPTPVSAIIRRVDTSDSIFEIVHQLVKYPYIKEIYIYNEVQSMPLSQQNFSVSVHLLDKNQTRFEACQQTLCYFQDDLWLNPYMDTLYTLACRYPQQWIANTRLVDYIDYMTWRFKQGELSTGYADLRYGAFVSKDQIERFLANDALDHTSDVHFSIGSNQFPYIIANPLYEEYERQDVRQDVYDALAVVVKGQVEKKEEVVMDVKSSCANDQCLFMTNMDMMPPPLLLDTISNYEIEYKQRYHLPAKNTIIYHSYHKAVDQDTETCWYSYQSPKEGDYFGLYLVGDIRAKRVLLYTSSPVELSISIQPRLYSSWTDCEIVQERVGKYRTSLEFECPENKDEVIKSIRMTFKKDRQEPFELCGIGLDNFVI